MKSKDLACTGARMSDKHYRTEPNLKDDEPEDSHIKFDDEIGCNCDDDCNTDPRTLFVCLCPCHYL